MPKKELTFQMRDVKKDQLKYEDDLDQAYWACGACGATIPHRGTLDEISLLPEGYHEPGCSARDKGSEAYVFHFGPDTARILKKKISL